MDKDLSQTDRATLAASSFVKQTPWQTETDKLLAKLSDVHIENKDFCERRIDNGNGYESKEERDNK